MMFTIDPVEMGVVETNALQADLPILEFSELDGARREEYYAAVRAGVDRNYRSMKRLFADIIESSLAIS